VSAALARRVDAPLPKKSSRRGGDDAGAHFRRTARAITRIPAYAGAASMLWLADTLDWLNLWHHNDDPAGEATSERHDSEPNHLSPRL
jgi:hypothetical protein